MTTTAAPDRVTHADNGFHANGHAPPAKRKRSALPWVVVLIAVLGLAAAAGAYLYYGGGTGDSRSGLLAFEVKRGPLVISVTEAGTIKAAEQTVIKNEIEGRVSILYLHPEGERVKQGDLLVELDVSALQDEKVDREIEVQNAEAAFVQAQEALAVAENQAKADVSAAELDYQFALEDIEKYREGDFPQELREAQNKVLIAEEELERAQSKREGSDRLLAEDFISQTEFDADVLSEKKAKLDLEVATEALNLLKTYAFNRQMAEFEGAVEQTELALDRAKRKASADVVQAEAELRAKEADFARQKDRLAKIIDQIAKAKITAPTDGLVVYATTGRGGWRGNDEPLQEGREVREREELIYLPTAEDRIAEIKIHESSLDKVREGLPTRVTVDALPGREYWGTVTKIAPLPDATTSWLNPDLKVYATEVRVVGRHPELKTGMSCRAEVIVETYDEATHAPVQSVVRVGGVPSVFVLGGEGPAEQREVAIGPDNNKMVVIESGVEPGERVLLNPPLSDTGSTGSLRMEDVPAEQAQQAEAAKANPTAQETREQQGGAAGGAGGAGGMDREAMMRVMQQLMAKATEEEKTRFREYFQDGDQAGAMEYGVELAKKYGIAVPGQPTTRPTEGGEGGEDLDVEEQAGEQAGEEADPRQQLMAKLTDAERQKLDDLRENQNWQELGPYMRELAEKYDVELPQWDGQRGGGGGQ